MRGAPKLLLSVVNGVVLSNGPTSNSNLASVAAGFDNNGVFLKACNDTNDTARGNNLVANLKIVSHALNFFFSLFLGANHKEVHNNEHKNEGDEHSKRA